MKDKKGFYLLTGIILACLIGAAGLVMPYPNSAVVGNVGKVQTQQVQAVELAKSLVDVDIYPETQATRLGYPVEYKITVTDNHPIARCGIALADEEATEASNTARCIVYYTYNMEVTGLPFDTEYSKSVTVYQGSSASIPLTIDPTYNTPRAIQFISGEFEFTVKATLSGSSEIYDSDSAILIVSEYRNCDLECGRRGYDYGACRTTCTSDEYDIGTEYCQQFVDRKLMITEGDDAGVDSTATVAVNAEKTASTEAEPDIYGYPTRCCCGSKGITVTAWPGKNNYNSGETATIYAKVYSTWNGEVAAKVIGTVKRPDGVSDSLTFRKICAVAEIKQIEEENPSAEISCVEEKCWPECVYVATYKDTEASGYYSVDVEAENSQGYAETTTGFLVQEEVKSCNTYCQEIGYDYGVCRTSCREGEKNAGTGYCLQTAEPIRSLHEDLGKMYCCCGNLEPPQPPEEKIEIELSEGWNLITLPGKGKLSLGTCEALYGFVYINGQYMSIKKAKEMLGEEKLMEYLRKNSFWAYSFKKCHLEFTLGEYTSYSELELAEGWNFLPITEDMIGKSLQEVSGDCELQKTYLWNAKKQRWDKLGLDDEFSAEQMFQGFIVKAESACSFGGSDLDLSPPPLPE